MLQTGATQHSSFPTLHTPSTPRGLPRGKQPPSHIVSKMSGMIFFPLHNTRDAPGKMRCMPSGKRLYCLRSECLMPLMSTNKCRRDKTDLNGGQKLLSQSLIIGGSDSGSCCPVFSAIVCLMRVVRRGQWAAFTMMARQLHAQTIPFCSFSSFIFEIILNL